MIAIERSLVTPRWQRIALPVASLVIAAVIAGIVLAASGHDPIATYQQIYEASFTSPGALTATFIYATPLLFTGLCVALAFRMRALEHRRRRTALHRGRRRRGRRPRSGRVAAASPDRDDDGRRSGRRGTLWAMIPGLLRAYLHDQRDPDVADAQLRGRPLHVLPDLRQHVLLARHDLAERARRSRRARPCAGCRLAAASPSASSRCRSDSSPRRLAVLLLALDPRSPASASRCA